MIFTYHKLVYLIWGSFFGYWFLSSFRSRSNIEWREPFFSRLSYLILLGVAILGTVIVEGELRGGLAMVLLVIAFLRKIRLEERYLRERLGPEYIEYQKRVKALIPFVY